MIKIHFRLRFKSFNGDRYTLNIYDKNYTGSEVVELIGGAQPFVTQETSSTDLMEPLRTQTGLINIIDTDGSLITQLYPSSATSMPVVLTRTELEYDDGQEKDVEVEKIKWMGFVSDESYKQDFTTKSNEISIAVRSVLETSKYIKLPDNFVNSTMRFHDFLNEFSRYFSNMDYLPFNAYRYIAFTDIIISSFNYRIRWRNFFDKISVNTSDGSTVEKNEYYSGKSFYDVLKAFAIFFGWQGREYNHTLVFYYNCPTETQSGTYEKELLLLDTNLGTVVFNTLSINDKSLDGVLFIGNNQSIGLTRGYNSITLNSEIKPISNSFIPINIPDDYSLLKSPIFLSDEYWLPRSMTFTKGEHKYTFYAKNESGDNVHIHKNFIEIKYLAGNAYTFNGFNVNFYYKTYQLSHNNTQFTASNSEYQTQFYDVLNDRACKSLDKQYEHLYTTIGLSTDYPIQQLSIMDYLLDTEYENISRHTGAYFAFLDIREEYARPSYNFKKGIYANMLPTKYSGANAQPLFTISNNDNSFEAANGFLKINIDAEFINRYGYFGSHKGSSYLYVSVKLGDTWWNPADGSWYIYEVFFPIELKDGKIVSNRQASWPISDTDGYFIPTGTKGGVVSLSISNGIYAETNPIHLSKEYDSRLFRSLDSSSSLVWDIFFTDISVIYLDANNQATTKFSIHDYLPDVFSDNNITKDIDIISGKSSGLRSVSELLDINNDPVNEILYHEWDNTLSRYQQALHRPELVLLERFKKYYGKTNTWIKVKLRSPSYEIAETRYSYAGKIFMPMSINRDWREDTSQVTLLENPTEIYD